MRQYSAPYVPKQSNWLDQLDFEGALFRPPLVFISMSESVSLPLAVGLFGNLAKTSFTASGHIDTSPALLFLDATSRSFQRFAVADTFQGSQSVRSCFDSFHAG